MRWILIVLGAAMVFAGVTMIVRFYRGRGSKDPQVASSGRVGTMILGVLLTSIGTLVFLLGLMGSIGASLGVI